MQSEIIDLNGAVVEIEFNAGNVAYITTHRPAFSGPGVSERINAVIDEYLPIGCTLSQTDFAPEGMVNIVKWKVNYE